MAVDKETKTGFTEEFDHLHNYQCKVLHGRKEGTKPVNQTKNRYPNIIPCEFGMSLFYCSSSYHINDMFIVDYNRVILQTVNRSSSDYINASYISVSVDCYY